VELRSDYDDEVIEEGVRPEFIIDNSREVRTAGRQLKWVVLEAEVEEDHHHPEALYFHAVLSDRRETFGRNCYSAVFFEPVTSSYRTCVEFPKNLFHRAVQFEEVHPVIHSTTIVKSTGSSLSTRFCSYSCFRLIFSLNFCTCST
jgi:hypothetical protein